MRDKHFLVEAISEKMQEKLDIRLERYPKREDGEDFWMLLPVDMLVAYLDEQVEELKSSCSKLMRFGPEGFGDHLGELAVKSADVANCAAMVADRAGALGRKSSEEDVFCTHFLVGGFGEKKDEYICRNCGFEKMDQRAIKFLKTMDRVEEHSAHDYDPVRNKEGQVVGLIKRKEKGRE